MTSAEGRPVVFVPGMTGEEGHFDALEASLVDAGYAEEDVSVVSFDTVGASHAAMRDRIEAHVEAVLAGASADAVDVVAYSRGVTGARYWMDAEDRYGDVDTFVGLGGANHGTARADQCAAVREGMRWLSVMTGAAAFGVDYGELVEQVCADDFLTRASADEGRLHDLNTPDETPGDVDYHTLRATDDPVYPERPNSPLLEGAERNAMLPGGHYDLVTDDRALDYVAASLTGEHD